MKKVISLIRKYNVQDKKVETRYNREFSGSYGITPCIDECAKSMDVRRAVWIEGKSSVLRKMEMKLADLNAEINECAKSMDVRRAVWDESIEEAGLPLDSWNHKLIFSLCSDDYAAGHELVSQVTVNTPVNGKETMKLGVSAQWNV